MSNDDLLDIVVTNGSDSTSFVELSTKVLIRHSCPDAIISVLCLLAISLARAHALPASPVKIVRQLYIRSGDLQAAPELRPPLKHAVPRWQNSSNNSEASSLLLFNMNSESYRLQGLRQPGCLACSFLPHCRTAARVKRRHTFTCAEEFLRFLFSQVPTAAAPPAMGGPEQDPAADPRLERQSLQSRRDC